MEINWFSIQLKIKKEHLSISINYINMKIFKMMCSDCVINAAPVAAICVYPPMLLSAGLKHEDITLFTLFLMVQFPSRAAAM